MSGNLNKLNSASKHSTFIDNVDSDSDSSSNESFLAVPEQFRPNLATRKSPVQENLISELKLIENKVSDNPAVSKALSYSEQPVKIPMHKNTILGEIEESSVEHKKPCSSGKPRLARTTPLLKEQKLPKETEQPRNKSVLEVNDEPIRCRNTRTSLKMAEGTYKPRAPAHQNRQKLPNTSVPFREVEKATSSEINEENNVENKAKDDHISLPKASNSVIDLDVANIPLVNEIKRNTKNKLKYKNLSEKADQNYSAYTKRNPVSYKYTKNNRCSKPEQVSFSIKKQECIRWNSNLNLNELDQNLCSFTPQIVNKMCQKSPKNKIEWSVIGDEKASDNKIEWTVVREEKTTVSARKLEDGNLNNCHPTGNGKTDSKILFKVTAKSSADETNIHIPTNRNEAETVPKGTIRQNARNDERKKTYDTRTTFYKNNLKKKKNVLMFIQASKDSRNSNSCEKSCNEIEYDCCKKYTPCDEGELSEEDHCYLCEASKTSNGINRSNRERTRDQLTNVNFREGHQRHQKLLSSQQGSFAWTQKTKLMDMRVSDVNYHGRSRRMNNDGYEQHVSSDEDPLSKESFCNRRETARSPKDINFQQLTCSPSRNANWLQENTRYQNPGIHNQKSFPEEEKSIVKLDDSKASEENKNSVLRFGREISDLVIGCHVALIAFFSIYNEWSSSRRELIQQFEQLEENIRDSSKKYANYSDILKVVDTGATIATATITHPYVSVAAKIVAVISSLLSKFINTSKSRTTDMEEPEIITSLFQDIELSSDLYMHGLQCNQQFEDTAKFVEEFHSNTSFCEFCVSEDAAMTNFIQGVLEYTPTHSIFYKKLHKCFQELIQKCSSPFSRRFCEPFELYGSDAVDVIGYLDWRFTQEFSNESVRHELEELTRLMQSKSTSMKDLLTEIGNCIRILKDEVSHVERCVSKVSMFDRSSENFKLNSK